jgi:DNA topoisomerase-1
MKTRTSVVSALRREITSADRVVLATDDDREGEAIAWHVCDMFGLPPSTTDRIVFHEITRTAVVKAYEHMGRICMRTVAAQQARQTLDILIGFKISPVLWKAYPALKNLSAGRCQTPALRLLCDAMGPATGTATDDGLGATVPQSNHRITGYFTDKQIPFTYDTDDQFTPTDFLASSWSHIHTTAIPPTRKIRTIAPPKGLSTVTLQSEAFGKLRLSPKQTMTAAQSLYDNGFITYMRTDSEQYCADFISSSRPYLMRKYPSVYVGDLSVDTNPVSSLAHEAIRPTDISIISVSTSSKSPGGKAVDISAAAVRLYGLIWKRTAESLMLSAKVDSSIFAIQTAVPDIRLAHTDEHTIFPGWKCIGGTGCESESTGRRTLDRIWGGGVVRSIHWDRFVVTDIPEHPISHLSEPHLIRELKRRGIGRPSTFAGIIETLKGRKYVTVGNVPGKSVDITTLCMRYNRSDRSDRSDLHIETTTTGQVIGAEKSKLIVGPIGYQVARFLTTQFGDIFEYQFTAQMERDLDGIVDGTGDYIGVCATYNRAIDLAIDLAIDRATTASTPSTPSTPANPISCVAADRVSESPESPESSESIDSSKSIDSPKSTDPYGRYDGHSIEIKCGKYGHYAKWGTSSCNLRKLNVPIGAITHADIVGEIRKQAGGIESTIVQTINRNISVRRGDRGLYIMRTMGKRKPIFRSMEDFLKWDQMTGDRDGDQFDTTRIIEYMRTKRG